MINQTRILVWGLPENFFAIYFFMKDKRASCAFKEAGF